MQLIITCEHGGNRVPEKYQRHFSGRQKILGSHRGFDAGALLLARTLSRHFDAPLAYSDVSRLLIDLNRSTHHRALHAPWLRSLPPSRREELLTAYYLPYRSQVEHAIAEAIGDGKVALHVSAHSFTPMLDGVERSADIGLLYDPARPLELQLCRRWQARLKAADARLRVRRNYPYLGKADGFVTSLRRRFASQDYIGVELEANQRLLAEDRLWRDTRRMLATTLDDALRACGLVRPGL